MADISYYHSVKKKILQEKRADVEALGYNLACGLGRNEKGAYTLEARLQPLPGSPDPISDDVFARIKNDLEQYLLDNQENVPLNIMYSGVLRTQNKI